VQNVTEQQKMYGSLEFFKILNISLKMDSIFCSRLLALCFTGKNANREISHVHLVCCAGVLFDKVIFFRMSSGNTK